MHIRLGEVRKSDMDEKKKITEETESLRDRLDKIIEKRSAQNSALKKLLEELNNDAVSSNKNK